MPDFDITLDQALSMLGKHGKMKTAKERIERLREVAEIYSKPCRFKVGDVVTPADDSPLKGSGQPHLVVEVFDEPVRPFAKDPGTTTFGAKLDMRVITTTPPEADSDSVLPFCAESWQYEPYQEEEDV